MGAGIQMGMPGNMQNQMQGMQGMLQMCQMMASNPMLFQMMNMMANSGQQEIPITMIGKRSDRASPSCPGTPASSPKNDSQEQEVPPSEPEAKAAEAPKIPLFDLGAPDEKDLNSGLQKRLNRWLPARRRLRREPSKNGP